VPLVEVVPLVLPVAGTLVVGRLIGVVLYS
jgi:hypothetical protein